MENFLAVNTDSILDSPLIRSLKADTVNSVSFSYISRNDIIGILFPENREKGKRGKCLHLVDSPDILHEDS